MSADFIVTGAAGFIGSNIVEALNKRGHRNIIAVDSLDDARKKKNLEGLHYLEYLDKAEFRKQFRNNKIKAFKGRDVSHGTVFHLGACSSTTETNWEFLKDNNYLYTRELCNWCLENNFRFIYASSAATYGDGSLGYSDDDAVTPALQPLNLYGKSKQVFDVEALKSGLLHKIVGLKYFNVYGPREDHKDDMRSVVNKAYGQIRETGKLKLFRSHRVNYGDGEQDRDFVYIKDAVDVTLYFHDHHEVSGIFNCGTGTSRTWLDLGKAVFKAMSREEKIIFIDMPEEIRDKYQYHTQADISKLRSAGYDKPFTSIENGAMDYIKNYLDKL